MSPIRQVTLFDESSKTQRATIRKLGLIRDSLRNDPYSMVARNLEADGQIVAAVVVNKMVGKKAKRDENMPTTDSLSSQHHQNDCLFGWIVDALISKLHRDVDLFSLYATDRIFKMTYGCIHPDYKRFGLAINMASLGLERAVANGAGAIVGETFSDYAANALKKYGFDKIKFIDLATFEVDGIRVLSQFASELDKHSTAHLMARSLPTQQEASEFLDTLIQNKL